MNLIDSSTAEGLGGAVFSPENNFPEVIGFNEFSELSNTDVENLITTLIPEGHLDNCSNIICNPNDNYWSEMPGAVGYHVEYNDGSPSMICLAGREAMEGTGETELAVLCHEIGHSAFNNMSFEDTVKWTELHVESVNIYNETGFGFVSNYAHTNLFEDFAESYSTYITNPDLLKFFSPEKYEFMKENLFNGVEYGQIVDAEGNAALVTKDVENLSSQVENQIVAEVSNDIVSSAENSSTNALFRCFSKVA